MGLILAVSISTVSAQDISSDSCNVCILKAATVASPTCDTVTLTDSLPTANSLTPKQQTCFCPLANNDAWIRSCVKPGGCLAADATLFYDSFSTIKGSKACADVTAFAPAPAPTQPPTGVTPDTGVSPANEAGSLMGSASSKILAGAAIIVA
ncbi:hypothetical protein BG015_000302, partial [Linnemannia schmuckeri]